MGRVEMQNMGAVPVNSVLCTLIDMIKDQNLQGSASTLQHAPGLDWLELDPASKCAGDWRHWRLP